MMILRFLLAALLVFVTVTVAAFVYLEWWQALLVIVAMMFAFVVGFKLIVRSFMSNLGKAVLAGFEMKGKVLRGATADVHGVEAVPTPPPRIIDQEDADADGDGDSDADADGEEDEDDEPDRNLAYYRIDVTIRPGRNEGPMTLWDLGDLCVVDHKARPISLTAGDDTDAGEAFHFEDVQVLEDGRPHPDEQGKYAGPQRVHLLVGVTRGLRELKFRYYTEDFGRIVLPQPYPNEGQPQLA